MIDSCWGSGMVCISRSFWLFRRRLQPTVAPQINHAPVLMEVSIGWAGGWDGFLLVGTVCWETHNPVTGQCQCWTVELLTQDCVAQRRRDSDLGHWSFFFFEMKDDGGILLAARFQLTPLASVSVNTKPQDVLQLLVGPVRKPRWASAPRTVTLCATLGQSLRCVFFSIKWYFGRIAVDESDHKLLKLFESKHIVPTRVGHCGGSRCRIGETGAEQEPCCHLTACY